MLDHVVGAGKTYTMCATIMERKRLGLNNWDCVIISHSAFEKISLNNQYIKTQIQKDLQSIEDILLSSDSISFVTKQLKKVKEGYQSKLEAMVSSTNKDKVLNYFNIFRW